MCNFIRINHHCACRRKAFADNAFAAARALDANTFSNFSDGKHRVSFDQVVEVMRQTGNDLPSLYKETSEGGLAKNMENSNN